MGYGKENLAQIQKLKDKIQSYKDGPPSATTLATLFEEVDREKDLINVQLAELNMQLEALAQLIIERFKIEGVSSIRLAGSKLVYLSHEQSAKVEDWPTFRQWCRDHGFADSLILHSKTVNRIWKDLNLDGQPQPDGVTLKAYTKVSVRKA